MVLLTSDKEDRIHNALIIGMALEDAYIYAGLTPQEIEAVAEDPEHQVRWRRIIKEFEFSLVKRMGEISQKQAKVGREQATTWMLEHMFPRYSGKPMNEMPDIHLHIDGNDPANYDTVTILNAPTAESTAIKGSPTSEPGVETSVSGV